MGAETEPSSRVAGSLLAGRYRLSAPLGNGRTGAVWEAVDLAAGGALRAVKFAARADALDAEWNALVRVEHPALPRAIDRGTTTDGGYFVMERVAGAPLTRGFAAPIVLRAVADVASALACLHEHGLLHGDVKPANVLVTTDHAVLVDLGFAQDAGVDAVPKGTLAFMAPELLAGEHSGAADLYALGVTAIVSLTGCHPLVDDARDREALLRALSRRARVRPSVLERVPANVRDALAALCDPEPARRGPTARAWLALYARGAAALLSPAQRASALSLDARPELPPPLCGRDRELTQGREALEAALAGDGLGVVLSGPAGVGRDRLADELVRATRVTESARGRYASVCFTLDEALAARAVDSNDADAKRTIVLRTRGIEQTRAAVEALSRVVAYTSWRTPVVLVGVCDERVALRNTTAIELAPLDDEALAALLASMAGVAASSEARAAWREATASLAGRVVTIAASFERGAIANATRAALLEASSALRPGDDDALSSGSLEARALGLVLTVTGACVDREALIAACDGPISTALPRARGALFELLRYGVALERDAGVSLSAAPCAPSQLRAIVARHPEPVRRLAASIAARLRERCASDLELVDRTTLAFGPVDEAIDTALRRGSDSNASAEQRAEWLFALRALAPTSRDAHAPLAAALIDAGRAREALDVLDARPAAIERFDAPEKSDTIDARFLYIDALRRTGARDEARAHATALVDDASVDVRAYARAVRAREALDAGDVDRAAEVLGEAPPHGDASDVSLGALRWFETAALVALSRERFDDAREVLGRAHSVAARLGAASSLARLASLEGMVAQAQGDDEAARTAYEAAHTRARSAGDSHGAATYAANLGAAHLCCGALAEALRWLDRSVRELARLGRMPELARALANLASLYALLGDRDGARSRAEQAERAALDAHDAVTVGLARIVAAECSLHGEAAAEALEAAAELCGSSGAPSLRREAIARAAVAYANAGLAERARELLARDEPTRDDDATRALADVIVGLASNPQPSALRAALSHARSLVSTGSARPETELLLLETTVRVADALRDEAESRRAREALDAACARLSRGLPAGAAALFVDAHRPPDPPQFARIFSTSTAADARWRRLAEITRELNSEARLRPLLERVMDAVIELTGAARGLLLLQGLDGALRVRTARNLGRRALADDELALSRSVAERVARGGEPLVTVDATSDRRLDTYESVHAMQLRSILAVPLLLHGRCVGTLYVDDRFRAGAFDDAALEIARYFADAAALAIHNARSDALLRRSLRRSERLARELRRRVERQTVELEATRRALSSERVVRGRYDAIVGRGVAMSRTIALVDKVAPTAMPVLLLGESGTGKELLARALHANSPRAGRPFVAENCASIPETLLESVLFGHVKGAFTGADRTRPGLFEVADGGTLFLDEVGEMSSGMQARLLRVLQEGELRPVGSDRARKVDVRVVAATHRDLASMVKQGTFREDLYYRLAVMVIAVPPLRDRREDIPALAAHVIEKHAGRAMPIEKRALATLMSAPWPGNVRQLENELMRACVLADGVIRDEDLSPSLSATVPRPSATTIAMAPSGPPGEHDDYDLRKAVDALERTLVERALTAFKGNQSRAARALGLSRFGLQKKLKRLGLDALPSRTKP